MSTPNITKISVYIEADGKVCLAPISAELAPLFLGMLSAFQEGQPKGATLLVMPGEVAAHVHAAQRALGKELERLQALQEAG